MLHRALPRALVVAAVSAVVAVPAADAAPKKLSSAKLQKLTTPTGTNAHLKKLQRIASAYSGTRVAGSPGFDASAQYVYDTLKASGYSPRFQPFTFQSFSEDAPTTFAKTAPTPVTYTADDFSVLEYSGAGDVTGTVVKTNSLGCTADELPAGNAGQVAVINRGTCSFREKVDAATTAGYGAAIIVNNVAGPLNGTLGEGDASQIPGIGVTQAVGNGLADGDTVNIKTVTTVTSTTTRNVIAETKGGNAKNTVVVGAHLDSVAEGPGINDNGSGSASILEIARQVKKIGTAPKNRIRFAWWSAEESGLVGATRYVASLTPQQQLDIGLYLNFDMVGSPNFARFIYDGDNTLGTDVEAPPGSDAIEANFESFFAKRSLATEPTAFDGRSDYGPFIDAGIPAGGLFTGAEEIKTAEQAAKFGGTAGVAFDPNYHQAGDTFANVSQQAIDEQSDAVADAVATYANSTQSVDDRDGVQGLRKAPYRPEFRGPSAVR